MATNEYEKLYSNVSRNGRLFLLEQRNGIRDYTQRENIEKGLAEKINANDKLLLITAKQYPYTTTDLGEMIYRLLVNKVILSARQAEVDKIYPFIRRAFTNTPIPLTREDEISLDS